ncbi:hypothetical protein [Streptomyces erythrochromogenes]|uniref:hypothetical protein n=1 Tax=Streptomyces erythrochromogenes TaxID=285574 RepID=UPI0033C4307C
MRYLEGVTLDAFSRGNRRMLAPLLAWAKEPVAVPEAAAGEPKAAEGEKPAKGSPAGKPEMRRRIGVRHLGYAAGGAFFLWPVVGGWVPTVLTTAPAVWAVAALIAGQQGEYDPGAEGDDGQEQPQDAEAGEADRGTALLLHVVGMLAEAEAARRAGVHLDVVLDSAAAAGLLPQDTEVNVLRAWVEGCGLPVEPKLGMRIEGKPVTRVGLRVDAVTTALGMAPAALLAARSQAPVQTPAAAAAAAPARVPAQAVGEGPAEAAPATPAEAPVPAPPAPPHRPLCG